jgi:hypothetical protein
VAGFCENGNGPSDRIKGTEFIDCDLLHDRPVLSIGRTPHDKQNRNCLDYSQNLVMRRNARTDWLTDWRNDWLTDWRNDWLTDGLTDWLTEWLTGWLTDWLTDWLTELLTDGMTDWLTDGMTDWLTEWLTDWRNDWLTDWHRQLQSNSDSY